MFEQSHIAAIDGLTLGRNILANLRNPELSKASIIVYRFNDFDFDAGCIRPNGNNSLIFLLERAMNRGVTVEFITRDPFTDSHVNSNIVVQWLAGLERLERAGASVHIHNNLHAKVYLFEFSGDRYFCASGSSNLTFQGMGFRWAECNVRSYHPADFAAVNVQMVRLRRDKHLVPLADWARQLRRSPRGFVLAHV